MNPHTNHRGRRIMFAVVALSAVVAACGGDDDETADTSEPAVTASGAEEPANPTAPTTETTATEPTETTETSGTTAGNGGSEEDYVEAGAQALGLDDEELSRCMSQALVDAIGFGQIEATGLTPQEFTEAGSLADIGITLDDGAIAAMQSSVAQCGDLVEAIAASESADEAGCAREHLTNDLVAESFVVGIAGAEPSEELAAARDAMQQCVGG